jgi:hypothetical protein
MKVHRATTSTLASTSSTITHNTNDELTESCMLAGYIERCEVLHGTSSEAARGSIRLSTLAHTVLAATTEAVTADQAEELQHG